MIPDDIAMRNMRLLSECWTSRAFQPGVMLHDLEELGLFQAVEHAGHKHCEFHSLGLACLTSNTEAQQSFEKLGLEPIKSDDADVASAVKSYILLRQAAKGFTRVQNLS